MSSELNRVATNDIESAKNLPADVEIPDWAKLKLLTLAPDTT